MKVTKNQNKIQGLTRLTRLTRRNHGMEARNKQQVITYRQITKQKQIEVRRAKVLELSAQDLTEEEENKTMRKTFQDIYEMGYEHIHTLKVVPLDCDRKPYYVHIDSLNGE